MKEFPMTKHIHIEGMSCAHCSSSVDKALRALPGVSAVQVDLASKTATVETDGKLSDEAMKQAVTDIGYDVTSIN
jgi:Cu+-exporting ATPase